MTFNSILFSACVGLAGSLIWSVLKYLWIKNRQKQRPKKYLQKLNIADVFFFDHGGFNGYYNDLIHFEIINEDFIYDFSAPVSKNLEASDRLRAIKDFIVKNYNNDINDIDLFISKIAEKIKATETDFNSSYGVRNLQWHRPDTFNEKEASGLTVNLYKSNVASLKLLNLLFIELLHKNNRPLQLNSNNIVENHEEYTPPKRINDLWMFLTNINLAGFVIENTIDSESLKRISNIVYKKHPDYENLWSFTYDFSLNVDNSKTTIDFENEVSNFISQKQIKSSQIDTTVTDVLISINDGLRIKLLTYSVIKENELLSNNSITKQICATNNIADFFETQEIHRNVNEAYVYALTIPGKIGN